MESLLLIAAYDQMAAALDELLSQMALCSEMILTLNSPERARLAKAYRHIEAAVTSIDELLAFERSEER